jgi:hypothetical protein
MPSFGRFGGGALADAGGAQGVPSGLGGLVAFATRALTSADAGVSFAVAAARTVTLATGLGASFSCAFYNTSGSAVVLTIAAPAGVTINGVTGGSITRTIPAYGCTAIQATTVADVYVAPGV